LKRILLHWSAGTHRAGQKDRKHYHFIVEGDGTVVEGNFKPEDNESTVTPYAAHTRGLNTGSIGVAVAAMHGAKERPFDPGKYPITEKQLASMLRLVARLAVQYDIPVTRATILTHAEVQPTLGVKQRNKWDIMWIPGMDKPGNPIKVGDELRSRIRVHLKPEAPNVKPVSPEKAAGLTEMVTALLASIFRRKN